MAATVSDILGKGFVFEQTAELQKLPAATGTILAGVGAANWGPIGIPTFLQTGLSGFEKIFGTTMDSTVAKDSSYLMMAYHFLSSSRGWYTRVAEGAVKSNLEWFIPDQAPKMLGDVVVKNKDFLLYDETDGVKENNKMTLLVTVEDGGTPVPFDIDIALDPSKKALLLTEDQTLPGGVVKSSYQKNSILKVQDGNDSAINEYLYTVVNADEFTKLKADVEAETYANFSIAWIRAALKYLKKTDTTAIPESIFKFKSYKNRANDGKLHGPLKLVASKALVNEAKAEIDHIVTEIVDRAYDLTSATAADISGLNGKYILLAPGSYLTATHFNGTGALTANVTATGTNGQIFLVAVSGSAITLTALALTGTTAFLLLDDISSGIGTLADNNTFTLTTGGVVAAETAVTAGQNTLVKGLTNQKRDILAFDGVVTYTPYANSPKIIINALYVDHTGSNNALLKYDGSAYTAPSAGSNKYYIKGIGKVFSVNVSWTAGTAALANGNKIVADETGTVLNWNSGTTTFEVVTDYKTLNPFIDNTGIAASAFTGVSSVTLPNDIYYKYKNSTSKFVPITVASGEFGLAAVGYGTVGGFADDTTIYAYNGSAFAGAAQVTVAGDVWISVNTGLLVYALTATTFATRSNNYDATTANVVAFESSDRGTKAFVRVIESVANIFALGEVSKAYGLNTPISTIISNINYQSSKDYQQYIIDNSLTSNINPTVIPAEIDRLLVATIADSNTLLLTTQQLGTQVKIRLNKISGVNLGDISSKNAYTILGLPNVANVTAYPLGYTEVAGVDQELVASFEAFYTGTDGNTLKFVNSQNQDGISLSVYFKNSLIAVFTNYSYNSGDSNYIGTLFEQDVNVNQIVVMKSIEAGKQFPFGTFQFSGGSSGGFPADEIYAAEALKYKSIDLYDIDILCVSGISSNTVISRVKETCEARQDCLGIIDPPMALSVTGMINWTNGLGDGNDLTTDDTVKLDSSYLATYYPWVNVPITKNGGTIYQWQPPSVRVAGSIAKNDNAQGNKVGAPAGIRTVFTDIASIEIFLTDDDKTRLYADVYNACVNPIVFTTVDGYFVDGQKTTWRRRDALRRINVARAGMYIKKRVQEAAKLFFWNPTDPASWSDYGVLLKAILRQLVAWRAAGEDYVVTTDSSVNTPEIVDQSGMIGVIDWTPTKVTERLKTISNIKETTTGVTTQVV